MVQYKWVASNIKKRQPMILNTKQVRDACAISTKKIINAYNLFLILI